MARIETLSAEQWAQMRDYREAQRRDALCTDRIDEAAAREAINRLYTTAGLTAPKYTILLQSPLQCLMARGLMLVGGDQLRDQLRDQLGVQLWSQLGSQLGSQLWSQLESQLGSQLWSQLWSQLRSQLGSQLWSQLWSQLESQLRSQLGSQLGSQLWSQLWSQLGSQLSDGKLYDAPYFIGGWDNYWLAFYDFGRQIGATYRDDTAASFEAYRAYAASCGVAYLYPDVAFVSDRPERICFDHQRRLHADDGPAVRWRDGYSIYAWRGLRVPAGIIDLRHERTAQQITSISNAEHRRAAIEIYGHVHGPERFATDLGAKLISEDTSHGRPRRLYQVGADRYLHVVNGSLEPDGSRREFLLGADPGAATPADAVAASYGRTEAKYREAVRT